MNRRHYTRFLLPFSARNGRIMPVFVLIVLLATMNQACLHTAQRELIPPDMLRSRAVSDFDGSRSVEEEYPFLKAHMKDGALYVFSEWNVDGGAQTVSGLATHYDSYRVEQGHDTFTVQIDSVAIFETNTTRPSSTIAAMTIITGISLGVTAFCIANPKACFGSCPTIYDGEGNLQAEGFSASIAPSLEDDDVDLLKVRYPSDNSFRLYVRNEALETHVIRSMNLLAVPKTESISIFQGIDGKFYQAANITHPRRVTSREAIDKLLLEKLDGNEYCSRADSSDLATKDTLTFSFERPKGERLGLIVGCRQSLMSTYLLYSSLGYLGTQAGYWIAQLERGGASTRTTAGGVGRVLGGIQVLVPDEDQGWTVAGTVNETGPLAIDAHLVPLPPVTSGDVLNIQLRMAKGHWRLDYVALANLDDCDEVNELRPSQVMSHNLVDEEARNRLLDGSQVLVTFPGDEYVIDYELPSDGRTYELFVKSRGYYLEWMRDEWIREENLARAAEIFMAPDKALRRMAPEFKEVEDEMEEVFWNSKYAH